MIRYNPEHLQQLIDDGKLGTPEGKNAALGLLEENARLNRVIKTYVESNKWIPVSERLPDEWGEYLCQDENGDIIILTIMCLSQKSHITNEAIYWLTHKDNNEYKVIAWQSLPKPYKEE